LTPNSFIRKLRAVPIATATKDQFFTKLTELVALAKDFPPAAFDEAAPEETTKHKLICPLLEALGYQNENIVPEFKIVGDQVDYLLRSDRPLLFLEAKSLIDTAPDLFEGHKVQVLRYLRNYRVSPEQARMERPVAWLVLTNFLQWHFIRVTEERPSFSFKLQELIPKREELWELLARENVEAGRLEELYDQSHKADLDKRFLADLKRWRLLIANGFALRNQKRSIEEFKLASQQLLDRFIFCRMLETHRLIEWNKLARAYTHYDEVYGSFEGKTFAEFLREALFQEIKSKFNTELFHQPLLCDELAIDNQILSTVIGHEPLHSDLAEHCGIATQGELFPFRHLYLYDFSRMSQDIMGAAYERFLAHRLFQEGGRIVIEDTDELRKKEGIYYTPRYIVDYIVDHTLGEKIKPVLAEALALLGYKNYKAAAAKIRELAQIKVLDPAMGSGSFLLRAFDKLVEAYADYNAAARKAKADRANGSGMLFDAAGEIAEEIERLGSKVATENLFGVDLDLQAIEVAKLNVWMRLMAVERDFIRGELDRRGKVSRPLNFLPDLRKNLRRGNSLIADKAVAGDAAFDWQTEFAETMKGGRFDVVIGNPPYGALFAAEDVENLAENFTVFREGVRDVYACFLEQSFRLAKEGASTGFIVPSAWLGGPDYQALRKELLKWRIEKIIDLPFDVFPDAYVDTAVVLFRSEPAESGHVTRTYAYPKKFQIERIQITEGEYGSVAQSAWEKSPGQKFVLSSKVQAFISKIREKNPKNFADYAQMKRGVLFDPKLLTQEKNGSNSHQYFEGDVYRYTLRTDFGGWIAFDDRIKERPAEFNWFEGDRILLRRLVNRRQRLMATLVSETFITNKNLYSLVAKPKGPSLQTMLGILNSRLASFLYTSQITQATKDDFPQVTIEDIGLLPCPELRKNPDAANIGALAGKLLTAQATLTDASQLLKKKVHHANRTQCNVAHYLQKDFAGAVKSEILIDDVQRKGFVHEINLFADGPRLTLSATVADDAKIEPKPLPVLRLEFQHGPLRQFIYALWRQFLDENSRKKKWTTGKKPEPIYHLIVNTLEPLVYLQPAAADNLRVIRDLMKEVETEAGSADLAALEAEIEKLDKEIDERVYELYGLTLEERAIVEAAAR
jgi:type I restriction-modification system DNA methylase subunit